MKIMVKTTQYNDKRYSKPWIANVDFSKDVKGKFRFGAWLGDCFNGLLVIVAEENDIIAIGQKDFRNPKQPTMDFYIATKEEELKPIGNKAEAYKLFLKNKKE